MAYNKANKLHIVSVVAVIRNNDGKYLVLKRPEREVAYPGMYTFPGGKVEDNETLEEALEKELIEEVGLKLKAEKILLKDKSFIRPDGQTVKVFSYLCSVSNPDELEIKEDFEDYKWVNLEELKSLSHVGIEEELIQAEKLFQANLPIELLYTKSIKE